MKDKNVAGILAILLGGIGIHKFYLGKIWLGVLYLLLSITLITFIIGFIEGIYYLSMSEDKFNKKYNGLFITAPNKVDIDVSDDKTTMNNITKPDKTSFWQDLKNNLIQRNVKRQQSKELKNYIKSNIHNYSLNPDLIPDIINKCKSLDLDEYDSEDKIIKKFSYSIKLWKIDHKEYEYINADIILKGNEHCLYYDKNTSLYENKNVTHRVNYGGVRGSVKIVKGVRYNVGSYKVKTERSIVKTLISTGNLYVTDQRLIFNSSIKNISINIKDISYINNGFSQLEISKDNSKPFYFSTRNNHLVERYLISLIK